MVEQSRNIVVSGAARGIGRSLSRHFLDKGHCVFLLDIQEDELKYCVETHLKRYASSGPGGRKMAGYALCDLRDPEAIRASIEAAVAFFGDGRIDVLVNNGGIASPQWRDGKTMEDRDTLAEWQAYVETNLTAPFVASQACLPYMKRAASIDEHDPAHVDAVAADVTSDAGPCVVHVGSFRAHQSDPNQEGYAATKAGQLGLMHSMAISLARWGIRVNLVAPGRIKAAHECRAGDEGGHEWAHQVEGKDVADHPVNRAGRPRDIAQAVDYLINAGFVTGEELTVDGGALKKKK
ncbi:major facilitator superfamily transporter [Apiospora arundinis]